MKKINVGLIGFGTIGTGVVKLLKKNRNEIMRKTGINVQLKKIADLDVTSDRGIHLEKGILTRNVNQIIKDPEIDLVVELIGGVTKARELIIKALYNGKHVVTANKALLSLHSRELFKIADKNNRMIGFEASVCGGIPIIKVIRESLVANKIKKIMGIVNGTTNFILSQMEEKDLDFNKALQLAQKKGFAEANPDLDISGEDAAHKLQILASYAFSTDIPLKKIYFEGIEKIDIQDIRYIQELGYKIKLLAIVKMDKHNRIECRVHPTIIPKDYLLASVKDEYNAVFIEGDASGGQIFYGKGAGSLPTASAVVGDIIDIAKSCEESRGASYSEIFDLHSKIVIKKFADFSCRYYLRFHTKDQPGVLAQIGKILGNHRISLTSVIQKETGQKVVPIVMLTHLAKEDDIQRAIRSIRKLKIVKNPVKIIRIENSD
ncbi:MAG: homoserine dehydrogenase [Spirochaetes bacterium]|nr:homoserine dehydrogenase [Spirochaetota bacterium]